MRTLARIAPALAALAFVPARPAVSQAPERVDALAEALLSTARLPSLSIAILQDGEIVYARAFGWADLERRVPATVDTRYRCASVSKVITATAVGRLVQRGLLDLDAPIAGHVATWPADPPITARQLAGHLAGVAHYQGADRIDRRRHYASVTESLDAFRDSPRSGDPGDAYTYSTHGYTLLSAVAEGAAGRPFLDLLTDDVFVPLGMTGSGPDLRRDPAPEMSTLYGRRSGDPLTIPRPEDPSYKWAGGGLVSTPSDLVRLAQGYLDGYLDPDLVEEMWTSQRTNNGESTGVGVAWRVGEDDAGRPVVHHSGSMGGARSTLVIWPETREAIAVMTNIVWPSSIMETGTRLMAAFRTPAAIDRALQDPVELAYEGRWTRDGESADAAGAIVVHPTEGWIGTPAPFAEWTRDLSVDRMPLRHLEGDVYLLVSPYGLYPVMLEASGSGWTGRMDLGSIEWRFQTEAGGPR